MADGATSLQPGGVCHLTCGFDESCDGVVVVVCGDLFPPCESQIDATHLMKSLFCDSVSAALPRILKNKVEVPFVVIAAMIRPSFAGSAPLGSPTRSTTVTSPMEVVSRCAIWLSFGSSMDG